MERLSELVEVQSPSGDVLGYLTEADAASLNLISETVRVFQRYLYDPYITYHARLAYERGLLSRGEDINTIQMIALASHLHNKNSEVSHLEEQRFLSQMMISNPEMYREVMKSRAPSDEDEEIEGDGEFEWRAPATADEFREVLGALGPGDFIDEPHNGDANGRWSDEWSD